MNRNFQRALNFTLKFEGGYSMVRSDPGNWTGGKVGVGVLKGTKYGIAAHSHPHLDIKNLTITQAGEIYSQKYWSPAECNRLADGVDGAVFDYAVNSGVAAALKSLRAVVGGPDWQTVKKLCAMRLSIYRTFKHWATFGKGWTNRVTAGEALWVRWALEGQKILPKPILEAECRTSKKTAASQTKGAGGAAAGSGGSATQVDPTSFDWANLAVGAVVIAGAVLAAYFIWRARVNKKRAQAYAEQAERTN